MQFNYLISVIIPCYNCEKYIYETIYSVLKQAYKKLEIIIIDDGSTDKSAEIIKSINDPRIKYYYQTNKGLSSARNNGIQSSKGKYLAFLDSDDVWLNNKLEKQITLLEKFDIVYCDYYTIDENGNFLEHKDIVSKKGNMQYLNNKLLQGNVVLSSASGVIIDRNIIAQIGYFNEKLKFAEDWEYFARIAWDGYLFGFVNERLVKLRYLSTSMQSTTKNIVRKESIENILDTFLCFPNLTLKQKSIIYSTHFTNVYNRGSNFFELLYYYIQFLKIDIKNLFDKKKISRLIKFIPKRIFQINFRDNRAK